MQAKNCANAKVMWYDINKPLLKEFITTFVIDVFNLQDDIINIKFIREKNRFPIEI